MKFPFFASIIAFAITLMISIKIAKKKESNQNKKFWEKEVRANNTRKKSLDSLNYIHLPEEFFQFFPTEVPPEVSDEVNTLFSLKDASIVNLSYISNTDLKLSYGAANLETLSQYDQNFVSAAGALQNLADYFLLNRRRKEAVSIMEFLVSSQYDGISTYRQLSSIYMKENDTIKLDYLITVASTLPGLMREPILKILRPLCTSDKTVEESILDILE